MTRSKRPASPPPAAKKPAAAPKGAAPRRRVDEDGILWEHVAASVAPLKGKRKIASAAKNTTATPPPPVAKKTAATKTKPQPIATPQRSTRDLARATPAALAPTAVSSARTVAGFDRATETKLRKGQLDIEGRIDLHGMTQDEAYRALSRFVMRAHGRHKRTLLVITGKGRVSQGGGVLRRLLPLWVGEGDLKACVLACTPAATKDGGDGAFYLRLRKHKN